MWGLSTWIQALVALHGLFYHGSSYCDVLRVEKPDSVPSLEKNQPSKATSVGALSNLFKRKVSMPMAAGLELEDL